MSAMQSQSILLVDDEKDILDFLSYNLKKEGYQIYTAENGIEGIEIAKTVQPTMILLDLMMPKMDGIEACQLMRTYSELKNTLIVFLTSRSEDYSQIAGFQTGADDYISKPIRPRLLKSKIESLLRRMSYSHTNTANSHSNGLVIDREKYLAELNGEGINLPKKEFELLDLLASRPGKVFSRDQILSKIWGNEIVVGERTIDVHIRKLREKLGDTYIRTIKGVGYTFAEK
jgi:two-component system, OmpR family, alkaline phosphatase synthesis response regulator PhoP